MTDSDMRRELREIARGLRAQLEWRARAGAGAAPGGPTARSAPELDGGAESADEGLEPAAAQASTAAVGMARAHAGGSPGLFDGGGDDGLQPPGGDGSHDDGGGGGERPRLTLAEIRADLGDCQRCKLAPSRRNIVFGVGAEDAALMFIGEAPGANEDRVGEPFVGNAGQLLDRMIVAMGWTRDTVYIANVLKCRPPSNRDPERDEIAACRPFLARQIESIQPRLIVTLGKPAAHLLLETKAPMSALRGRFRDYRGFKVMPTFHPAYLLRSPQRKRDTWDDLKQVIAELERIGVAPPHTPKV